MAKDDVVRHDLTSSLSFHPEATEEPMELPPGRGTRAPLLFEARPPKTRRVTTEELTEEPFRSVGKMRLQFDPLQTKSGSGWVVAPNAFITAGHCVYFDKYGGWIIAGAFCPRFDGTNCPKAFTVKTVYTLQGWIDDNDDHAYDLAACVVTEAFGETEPPLPWEPLTLPPLKYVAIGYPIKPTSKHDFNGKRMWRSQGDFSSFTNNLITAANDLGGGASGGPWMTPPDGLTVGGITASRDEDKPDVADSPAFLKGFQNLYNAVKDL